MMEIKVLLQLLQTFSELAPEVCPGYTIKRLHLFLGGEGTAKGETFAIPKKRSDSATAEQEYPVNKTSSSFPISIADRIDKSPARADGTVIASKELLIY